MFLQAVSEFIKNIAALMGRIELTSNSDEVAEAIDQVKATERLPDNENSKDQKGGSDE